MTFNVYKYVGNKWELVEETNNLSAAIESAVYWSQFWKVKIEIPARCDSVRHGVKIHAKRVELSFDSDMVTLEIGSVTIAK